MPKFSLDEGDTTGHVFGPTNPERGDHLLIVERELLDPTTGQQVGTITAALTYMEIISADDALLVGMAEHRLTDKVKPPAKEGVISAQGVLRFSDKHPVFSIVGGTGGYSGASGTVTLDPEAGNFGKFNYDVH